MMLKNKAFTLIELLVVIAIVGLISSVVLVSLKGTREKARIAKALDFSHTIQHALGAYAVGIWRFEEIGDTALDSSGYGNNGTIAGATRTNGILGSALSFDGSSNYISLGTPKGIPLGKEITIEAWIKPAVNITNGYQTIFDYGEEEEEDYDLSFYGAPGIGQNLINFYDPYLSGPPDHYSKESLLVGKWYHVAITYNGNLSGNNLIIYINGKEDNSYAESGILSSITNYPSFIGAKAGNHNFFNGVIDEVKVYDSTILSAREIQKHYAEGSKKHQNY